MAADMGSGLESPTLRRCKLVGLQHGESGKQQQLHISGGLFVASGARRLDDGNLQRGFASLSFLPAKLLTCLVLGTC